VNQRPLFASLGLPSLLLPSQRNFCYRHPGRRQLCVDINRFGLCVDSDCLDSALCNNVHTPAFGKRSDHPLGKSPTFLGSHFSCERDKQPTFKLEINSEMLFIYRLTPRRLGFLGWIDFFDPTPISRFFGPSFSVHGLMNIKMHVYWDKSIDMHFMVLPVKFDNGLSI
jgi:hypothetical protein